MILNWVLSFGAKKIASVIGGGVVVILVTLAWRDYVGAKDALAAANIQIEYEQRQFKDWKKAARDREAKLILDLHTAREVAERRHTAHQETLVKLSKLENIERPEHEKDCPVHPAIVFAIDSLHTGTERKNRSQD